ncbi:hypothetical protein ACFY0G_32460 [Streptomyces sp. NPDC001552]|uniref:hypothetical protein n=1 Tax=Streptomyces sp. NPDC001552 TaxID=3364587 RepID=UPI0036CF6DDC
MHMIETRVCIDDLFGPFDCQTNPGQRWNGWVCPRFTLGTVRELSAQTLRAADEYGYEAVPTVHVIDGRADSAETLHLIEGNVVAGERLGAAVRINWRDLSQGAADAVSTRKANAKDRKRAAAGRKPGGRGARRSVVIVVDWQWMSEDGASAAYAAAPGDDGRYGIGSCSWTWHFASWWCVCGNDQDWHETECLCGRTRDHRIADATSSNVTAARLATILRTCAPEASAALVDLTDLPRVITVFTGGAEADMGDDTGPFDAETLGEADEVLRDVASYVDLRELTASWEHVPDEASDRVYRVTFPGSGA